MSSGSIKYTCYHDPRPTTHDQQSNSEKVIRELSSSLTVINCRSASASGYQAPEISCSSHV